MDGFFQQNETQVFAKYENAEISLEDFVYGRRDIWTLVYLAAKKNDKKNEECECENEIRELMRDFTST